MVASYGRVAASRLRSIGLLAAGVQLVLAVMLMGVASRSGAFPNPLETIPRGVALALLYALPAVVGAIGALQGRRALLAAASAASAIGSVLAFSGVTLIFGVPAILFAAAAGAQSPASPRLGWRGALLLPVGLAAVVLAVIRIGILVLPLLIFMILAVELWRGGRSGLGRNSAIEAIAAALIVVLVVGAGVALFSTTETRCWAAERTAAGVVYRDVPERPGGLIELSGNEIAGGCDSGALTWRGAAFGALLAALAVGLALIIGRGRTAYTRPHAAPAPQR
jgi:hypothetical protein